MVGYLFLKATFTVWWKRNAGEYLGGTVYTSRIDDLTFKQDEMVVFLQRRIGGRYALINDHCAQLKMLVISETVFGDMLEFVTFLKRGVHNSNTTFSFLKDVNT